MPRHHFLNVMVSPGRCVNPGVAMAVHICSSFTIDNDYSSEVNSLVDSLREISEYQTHFITL